MAKLSLQERLRAVHPTLMRDVTYGCSVGDGWYEILSHMLCKIETACRHPMTLRVIQIKATYGGLRVSVDHYGEDASIAELIKHHIYIAERESLEVCELCGVDGPFPNRLKWAPTYCEDCQTIVEIIQ